MDRLLNKEKYFNLNDKEKLKIKDKIIGFLSSINDISFVFLYGSFLDNQNEDEVPMPFKDIDIGIYLKGFDKEILDFSFDISEKLTKITGYPIDIRILNNATISFLFHVVTGELIIDNEENFRCDFVERVVRHYLDMKPLNVRAIKEAFG